MDYKAPWEHEPPSNVSDILECQLSPQKHETNKQNPLKRFKESLRRIGRKRVLKNANLAINETISLLNSTSKTWDETLTDESQNKAQYITQRAKKLKLNRSANETKRTPNEVKNAPKKRKKGQQKRIDKNCPALNLSTFTEKNTLVFKTNNLFNQQISDVDPTPVNQHQRKGQKCRKELLFTGDMSDRRKSGGSMGFNFNLKTPNQSLGNSTYGNNSFPNNSFNRPNGQQQHSNGHHQQMHAPNNWNGQQQRPGTARTNGARQQPYGKKPPRNASELQISNAIGGFVRGNRQEDQGFCESPNQHPHNYAQQSQHNVVLTAAPDVRYQRRGAIHMVAGDAGTMVKKQLKIYSVTDNPARVIHEETAEIELRSLAQSKFKIREEGRTYLLESISALMANPVVDVHLNGEIFISGNITENPFHDSFWTQNGILDTHIQGTPTPSTIRHSELVGPAAWRGRQWNNMINTRCKVGSFFWAFEKMRADTDSPNFTSYTLIYLNENGVECEWSNSATYKLNIERTLIAVQIDNNLSFLLFCWFFPGLLSPIDPFYYMHKAERWNAAAAYLNENSVQSKGKKDQSSSTDLLGLKNPTTNKHALAMFWQFVCHPVDLQEMIATIYCHITEVIEKIPCFITAYPHNENTILGITSLDLLFGPNSAIMKQYSLSQEYVDSFKPSMLAYNKHWKSNIRGKAFKETQAHWRFRMLWDPATRDEIGQMKTSNCITREEFNRIAKLLVRYDSPLPAQSVKVYTEMRQEQQQERINSHAKTHLDILPKLATLPEYKQHVTAIFGGNDYATPANPQIANAYVTSLQQQIGKKYNSKIDLIQSNLDQIRNLIPGLQNQSTVVSQEELNNYQQPQIAIPQNSEFASNSGRVAENSESAMDFSNEHQQSTQQHVPQTATYAPGLPVMPASTTSPKNDLASH
ncbi:unnamed protein product [Oikopleura dioica]|uniref:Uncharacterized protein n=1 Tax=Oikopleura dioica TaxID=34765 RepID=E4WZR1_OIKDI|nr:unnamed protein product [Oikopleura dioica]